MKRKSNPIAEKKVDQLRQELNDKLDQIIRESRDAVKSGRKTKTQFESQVKSEMCAIFSNFLKPYGLQFNTISAQVAIPSDYMYSEETKELYTALTNFNESLTKTDVRLNNTASKIYEAIRSEDDVSRIRSEHKWDFAKDVGALILDAAGLVACFVVACQAIEVMLVAAITSQIPLYLAGAAVGVAAGTLAGMLVCKIADLDILNSADKAIWGDSQTRGKDIDSSKSGFLFVMSYELKEIASIMQEKAVSPSVTR